MLFRRVSLTVILAVGCLGCSAARRAEVQHVGTWHGKPPLRKYLMRLSVRNTTDSLQWVVVPRWAEHGLDLRMYAEALWFFNLGPGSYVEAFAQEGGFRAFPVHPGAHFSIEENGVNAIHDAKEIEVWICEGIYICGRMPLHEAAESSGPTYRRWNGFRRAASVEILAQDWMDHRFKCFEITADLEEGVVLELRPVRRLKCKLGK